MASPPPYQDNPKAAAKAAKAYAKASRPWYRKKRFSLSAVVLVIVIIVVSKGGGGSKNNATPTTPVTESSGSSGATASAAATAISNNTGSHPAADDVVIKTCTDQADTNFADATVVVTNHTSKTSNYIGTVVFTTSSGQQLGTGNFAVNDLEAGQSSTPQDADSLQDASGSPKFTCKIGDVTRYAS